MFFRSTFQICWILILEYYRRVRDTFYVYIYIYRYILDIYANYHCNVRSSRMLDISEYTIEKPRYFWTFVKLRDIFSFFSNFSNIIVYMYIGIIYIIYIVYMFICSTIGDMGSRF